MNKLYIELDKKYNKYKNYRVTLEDDKLYIQKNFKYMDNKYKMSNEYVNLTITKYKYIDYYKIIEINTLGFNNEYKIERNNLKDKLDTLL